MWPAVVPLWQKIQCMKVSEANVRQAVELLKVLISTPSVSREEGEAADKLQLFIERGAPVRCEVHRHLNNLWCVAPDFDASRPTLLLDAHIDTVKPVSGWSKHPFTPIVEGTTGNLILSLSVPKYISINKHLRKLFYFHLSF